MEATGFLRACGKLTGPWAQVPSADRGSGIRPRAVLQADVRAEGPGASKRHHAYADSVRHGHPGTHTHTGAHAEARTHTPAHPHGRGGGPSGRTCRPATCVPRTSCSSLLPAPTWLRAGQPERERGTSLSTSVPSCVPRPGLPLAVLLFSVTTLTPVLLSVLSLGSVLPSPFFLLFLPRSLLSLSLSLFPYLAFLLPSPSLQPSLSFPSFPLIRLLSRAPPGFIMHPVQIDRNVLWYPGRATVSACRRPACLTPVAPCSS